MKNIAERLKFARNKKGWTQSQLAVAAGVSAGTIGNIESEARQAKGSLPQIAEALGISYKWLAHGTGPMELDGGLSFGISLLPATQFGQPVAVYEDGDVLSDDYIQIKEFEVKFSAGNGRTPVFDEMTDSVAATYRVEWFQRMGINPGRAIRVKVHGNSMEPFLYSGDTVLVNLAETNIINGKVYALRYGEELRIKRVYRKLDGSLILHSDNADFLPRDEEVPPTVVDASIAIIGRVRDKSGSGGL